MNISPNLAKRTSLIIWTVSIVTGFTAGAGSLLLSVLLQPLIDGYTLLGILLLATVEEGCKAIGLFGLRSASSLWHQSVMMLFSGSMIGLGFGLFELVLILLNAQATLSPTAILVLGIHTATGLIIGLGVLLNQRFPVLFVTALLLAIGLHVWYNHIVIQTHALVHP